MTPEQCHDTLLTVTGCRPRAAAWERSEPRWRLPIQTVIVHDCEADPERYVSPLWHFLLDPATGGITPNPERVAVRYDDAGELLWWRPKRGQLYALPDMPEGTDSDG